MNLRNILVVILLIIAAMNLIRVALNATVDRAHGRPFDRRRTWQIVEGAFYTVYQVILALWIGGLDL